MFDVPSQPATVYQIRWLTREITKNSQQNQVPCRPIERLCLLVKAAGVPRSTRPYRSEGRFRREASHMVTTKPVLTYTEGIFPYIPRSLLVLGSVSDPARRAWVVRQSYKQSIAMLATMLSHLPGYWLFRSAYPSVDDFRIMFLPSRRSERPKFPFQAIH